MERSEHDRAARLRRRVSRRWRASLIGHAWIRSERLDLGSYTLALAAQQLLCMVPALVAVSAILTRFGLGSATDLINGALGLNALGARAVSTLLPERMPTGWVDLAFGFVLAMLFLTGVAATTQRILEVVWRRERTVWRQWWTRIVWALSALPLFVGAITVSHLISPDALAPELEVLFGSLAFGVLGGLFYWWTQWLLLMREVPWSRLLPGTVVIATGSILLLTASNLWLSSQIDAEVRDYGLIGATFILSVWVLTHSSIVVGGLIISAVVHERRVRSKPSVEWPQRTETTKAKESNVGGVGDLFNKAKKYVGDNPDKTRGMIDKVEGFVDKQTKGKYSDQIRKGGDAVEDRLGVDDTNPPTEAGPTPPAEPTVADATPGDAPEPPAGRTDTSPTAPPEPNR